MQGESLVALLTGHNTTRCSPIGLEHYGEHKDTIHGCPQYENQGMAVSLQINFNINGNVYHQQYSLSK
jgi:hypothetical protein